MAHDEDKGLSVTVAICTGMAYDLTALLASLLQTDIEEILLVGTEGKTFPPYAALDDPRVKLAYAPYLLAYKRNRALEVATSDILAFVDDDAVVSADWEAAIRRAFRVEDVGVATGPSLLPPTATLWKRTAQLAMGSSQYSRNRYFPGQEGYVEWFNVIGANMAYRKKALDETGICPDRFSNYGEDMFLAFSVHQKGWKVYYAPEAFVYHQPHGFWKQLSQIHNWGRAEIRLKKAGVTYPARDASYLFYIPTLTLFAVVYVFGELKQKLIGDADIRLKSWLKKRLARSS